MEWWRSLDVVPVIAALRERAEEIRRRELERTLGRLPDLDDESRQRIEAMTAAIVKKMLDRPIARLKDGADKGLYMEALEDLFDLHGASGPRHVLERRLTLCRLARLSSAPAAAGSRSRQTEIALEALRVAHPDATFEVQTIRTTGDRTTASLSEIGGRGVFVIEIERALLDGEIDIAVHSLKDLPTEETPGLAIAAVLPREDPRDVLVSRTRRYARGPPGGAPSARAARGARRRCWRCGRTCASPTSAATSTRASGKVESGEYDAVVLAAAGLARLGWLDRASQVFEPSEMLPAAGQGALAVQVRTDDPDAVALALAVDDAETRAPSSRSARSSGVSAAAATPRSPRSRRCGEERIRSAAASSADPGGR